MAGAPMSTKPVDFLGRELNVGDEVVFLQIGYRNLLHGTITKITPQKVVIKHEPTNVCSTETIQHHQQVIKI